MLKYYFIIPVCHICQLTDLVDVGLQRKYIDYF